MALTGNLSQLRPLATPPDPLERAGKILQIKNAASEIQTRQNAQQKQAALEQVLQGAQWDPNTGMIDTGTLQKIDQIDPEIGATLRQHFQTIATGKATEANLQDEVSKRETTEERAKRAEDAAVPAAEREYQAYRKSLNLPDTAGTRVQFKMQGAKVAPGDVILGEDMKPAFTNPKPDAPPAPPRTVTTAEGVMQWVPETNTWKKIGNRPPTAGQVGTTTPPGDWTKQGKDFLETIPAQWRKTIEKIASYDEDPTKVASMRGGMREQLMQWVNQVNPEYDTTLYGNRAPTRKAFTTGTQGQQINAINTAIGHIDQILTLAPQLNNSSFVPGNELRNKLKVAFGEDAVTNFDTLKDALAGEVASVLSKGSATVSGIAEAKEHIKAASSPQQLAGYVKTLLPVMGSKLNALDYQYHQTMGPNDPFSALSPEAKAVLRKHGIDPSDTLGGGGGTVKMQAPDGTVKDVPADQVEHYKSLGAKVVP